MRLRILHVVVFALLTVSGFGANIKGVIEDGNTKEPVSYATIVVSDSLKQYKDMSAIATEDGSFSFNGVKPGSYTLKVSFVGYKELVVRVDVPKDNSAVNLHKLNLHPTANALDEVNVTGQKSQMRFEIDRKVFDMDQSIATEGVSASDALRNIPSVSVDQEGKISLRNNPNVDLWINGKPSGLTGDSRAQYLEQLPAGSIQSIEVITNPGSKYSAEGTAGAINLVLKKGANNGSFGSVTASADTWGGVSAYGNYNLNTSKVDFGMNAGAQRGAWLFYNNIHRLSWQGNDTTVMNQHNDSNYKNWGFMLRGNLTYRITDKDDIQFMVNGMGAIPDSETSLVSSDGTGTVTRDRVSDETGKFGFFMGTADYTHKFAEAHTLRVYGAFFYFGQDGKEKLTQTFMNRYSAQQQNSRFNGKRGNVQLDYSNQINKIFKIECGYSGLFMNGGSGMNTFQGPDLENMHLENDLSYDFTINADVHALYATFSGKVKSFGFLAGLRSENIRYGVADYTSTVPLPDYKHNFFHLFPSVFLSYALPKNNELQLNYTNRVNYPNDQSWVPIRQITDSTTISYGNPAIKPEFSQSVEFNYIKNWDNHTLSASAYYRFADGVIQQVSYYEDPVMYYTYENVTRQQNVGVELVSKNKLWKILDLTTTVNLYYQKQNPFDFVYVDNSGATKSEYYDGTSAFTWTLRFMGSLILPKDIMFQTSVEYNAPQVLVQGRTLSSYAVDLGLRKNFLNKKLSVSVAARNIFSSRSWTRETYGDNFYQHQKWVYGKWQLRFSISYNFGRNSKGKSAPQQQDIINAGDAGIGGAPM